MTLQGLQISKCNLLQRQEGDRQTAGRRTDDRQNVREANSVIGSVVTDRQTNTSSTVKRENG